MDIVISADATAIEVHDLDAGDVPISWPGPLTDLPVIMAEAGIDDYVTTAEVWRAVDQYLTEAGFIDDSSVRRYLDGCTGQMGAA